VIVGVFATSGYYNKRQRVSWIVEKPVSQLLHIKISEKVSLKHYRYWFLWLVVLVATACSTQTDSSNPLIQSPIAGWIISVLLLLVWFGIGVFILIQIYECLVKRDVTYTLGGILGLIVGLGIEFLGNSDELLGFGLPILGMNLGSLILKSEIQAKGIYAFIIGFLWLGVLYGYVRISYITIQSGII